MQIRCPYCHHSVEVVDETLFADVTCPSCGSNISLVSNDNTTEYLSAGARQLGHFRLLDRVGVGGFGTVWKAHDTVLDRIVALKVPRRGELDAAEAEFFFRDARAAAQLRHPHIVSVHEVGRDGDTVFIASDYIEGANLHEWLSVKPVTIREAAQLMADIADAVHHAHARGVVHRDLKPGNILIDLEGHPHITDFGLAKRETGEITMTLDGQILGTPAYMSPEQAQGKAHEATSASDVYSLGVILFELLTGELPFRGEKRMLILQIINDDPPSPRKLNGRVPRDLETICLKAMSKEPARRYGNASALADDLRRYLRGEAIVARPVSKLQRAWRWSKRNRVVAGLSAAVLVLMIAVTIVSLLSRWRLSAALAKTQLAERTARLREADALLGQAHGTRLSRRPGQRFEALASLESAARIGREFGQPPEWTTRLRNEAIATLALPDIHITNSWADPPQGTLSVVPSHDFQWYARALEDGTVTVHRTHDQSLVAQLPSNNEPCTVAFGPRKELAVRGTESNRLWLWDLTGDVPQKKLEEQSTTAIDFRPDGSQLLIAYGDHSTRMWDVVNDKWLPELSNAEFHGGELLLHPTEPYFLDHSYYADLVLMLDMRSGTIVDAVDPPWRGNGRGAWTPDGRHLAIPDGNGGGIVVYALELDPTPTLRKVRELEASTSNGGNMLTINARGDRLLGRGWGGVLFLWDWPSGRLLFSSLPLAGADARVFWEKAGPRAGLARLGDRQERVGAFSIADGRHFRQIAATGHSLVAQLAVHPGGRILAVGAGEEIILADLATGEIVKKERIPEGVANVQFAENGDMYTQGWAGVIRWPCRPTASPTRGIAFGPPEILPLHPAESPFAISSDGGLVLTSAYNGYGESEFAGGWILERDHSAPHRVAAGESMGSPTIRPDGKRVAYYNRTLCQLQEYDLSTLDLVHHIKGRGTYHHVRYTRDGKYLATDLDGGLLMDTTTGKPVRILGPGELCDVSPDSELALFLLPEKTYRLVKISTGDEIGRFEDPEQNGGRGVFLPDGSGFVTMATDAVHVWDLRRIRKELAGLGLDWDVPSFTGESVGDLPPEPLNVTIVNTIELVAELLPDPFVLANWYPRFGQWEQGRRILEDLLSEDPNNHWVYFQLAVLQLHMGDIAAYRRTAHEMLLRFENGTQSSADKGHAWRSPTSIMDRTAKVNLLLPPESPEQMARIREISIRVVGSENADEPLNSWYAISRGLAELRAGNYLSAEKQVRSLAEDGDPASERTIAAQLILCMAHHRLGRVHEASQEIAEAVQGLQRNAWRFGAANNDRGTGWADWLICDILRREAHDQFVKPRLPTAAGPRDE